MSGAESACSCILTHHCPRTNRCRGNYLSREAVHRIDDDRRALLLGHLQQRLNLPYLESTGSSRILAALASISATLTSASAWICLALAPHSARAITASSSTSAGGVSMSVMRTARMLTPKSVAAWSMSLFNSLQP